VKDTIKTYWNEKSLSLILFVAIFLRLAAVIFSKGFGWHDDHFLVIEASQSWVDGTDYNHWLPVNGNATPSGHSFFYVGIHYIIFSFLKWIGMTDPQSKMYVIRFLHALLSLVIIVLGYRITEKLSDRNTAKFAGLLLAAYWFMPFLSVRNLVEFVSIPFLMVASWLIIKNDNKEKLFRVFTVAGIFCGMAMCIRFQSVIFVAGLGAALLLQKKWKELIYLTFGSSLFFGLFQGINDYLIWKRPFAEFSEYVRYNIENAHTYLTNTWYSYITVILGLLLPPLSIFLLFGFFKTWKKHLILFLPSFLFLLFHSWFPNKQERFILTIVPFIIILGAIGWNEFVNNSDFWQKRKRLLTACYIFSVSLNCFLLPFITTMYSKQSRVESMVYLSNDDSIHSLAFEDTNHSGTKLAPRFYLKKWIYIWEISGERRVEKFVDECKNDPPEYILFFEEKNLEQRVAKLKSYFPALHYETTVGQNFIDALLHRMNPNNNVNQVVFIYKVN
jgi:4-amino-4-deoxy-L-arabinose transferase-like glycosyltransferase